VRQINLVLVNTVGSFSSSLTKIFIGWSCITKNVEFESTRCRLPQNQR
jgi:hypothetical protein